MKQAPMILSVIASTLSRRASSRSACKRHSTADPEVTSMTLSKAEAYQCDTAGKQPCDDGD